MASAASLTAYLPNQGTNSTLAASLAKVAGTGNITTVATTYNPSESEIEVSWKTESGVEKITVYQVNGVEDGLPIIPSAAQSTEYAVDSVNSDGEATFQMVSGGTDPASYCGEDFENCLAFYPQSDVWA